MKAVLFDLYETLVTDTIQIGVANSGVLAWVWLRTILTANGGRGTISGCEESFPTTIRWFGTFARRLR